MKIKNIFIVFIILFGLLLCSCPTGPGDELLPDSGTTNTDPDPTEDTGSLDGKTFYFSGVNGSEPGYWTGSSWTGLKFTDPDDTDSNVADPVAHSIFIKDTDIYVTGDYEKTDWSSTTVEARRGGYWKNSNFTELPSYLENENPAVFDYHKWVYAWDIFVGEKTFVIGKSKMSNSNAVFPTSSYWLDDTIGKYNEESDYCTNLSVYTDSARTLDILTAGGYYANTATDLRPCVWIFDIIDSGTTSLSPDKVSLKDSEGNYKGGEVNSVVLVDVVYYDSSTDIVVGYELYAGGSCDSQASVWHVEIDATTLPEKITQTITVLDTSASMVHEVVKTENNLYAGGYITNNSVKVAGYWKNSVWNALGSGTADSEVISLDVAGSDVLAGGYITNGNGKVAGYWYNGTWNALGDGSQASYITDSCVAE